MELFNDQVNVISRDFVFRLIMLIFMVAEKPSLALSISQILSNGQLSSKKGFNNVCSIHEWTGRFQSNPSARLRMTSVAGHIFGIDFIPQYNNWDKVDPVSESLSHEDRLAIEKEFL